MKISTHSLRIEEHRKILLEMVVSENRQLEVDPLRGFAAQELLNLVDQYSARTGRFAGSQSGTSRFDFIKASKRLLSFFIRSG